MLARRVTYKPNAGAAMQCVRNVLGMQPWHKQEEIIRGVFGDRPITAVQSAHGVGKTITAAAITLAWIATAPHRIAVTTAPTNRQVRRLMWKELRRLYRQAEQRGKPIGGRMPPNAPELDVGEDWYAVGFASNDPINMQGFHARGGVLLVLDEAAGVPAKVWDALKGAMTGPNDRMLAIGNPQEPSGSFYEACTAPALADRVTRIKISAFDSPNVREDREVIPGVTGREWIRLMAADWGEGSPMWQARVLGEFPARGEHQVFPSSWLDVAVQHWHDAQETGRWAAEPTGWGYGVDVARFGANSTAGVVAHRRLGVYQVERAQKMDLVSVAGWARERVLAQNSYGRRITEGLRVDGDGMGSGPVDMLRSGDLGSIVVEMRGGFPAFRPERYVNRRAEWFWTLREQLEPSKRGQFALPPDPQLLAQLAEIRWGQDAKGRIRIETKEEMAARGVKSPDLADATAYATANTGAMTAPTMDAAAFRSSYAMPSDFNGEGSSDAATWDDISAGLT